MRTKRPLREPVREAPGPRVKNYITPAGLQRLKDEHTFLLVSPWPFRPMARAALQAKPVVVVLPKRAFSSADITAFRDLSQQHLSIWAKNAGASQSAGDCSLMKGAEG